MRRKSGMLCLILSAVLLGSVDPAMAQISKSGHNMDSILASDDQDAAFNAGVCSPCHVPHSAKGARLFTAALTQGAGPPLKEIGVAGAICGYCHFNASRTNERAPQAMNSILGAGIYNREGAKYGISHPLEFDQSNGRGPSDTLITVSDGYGQPWTNPALVSGIWPYAEWDRGRIECTTCHNPHQQTYPSSEIVGLLTNTDLMLGKNNGFLRAPIWNNFTGTADDTHSVSGYAAARAGSAFTLAGEGQAWATEVYSDKPMMFCAYCHPGRDMADRSNSAADWLTGMSLDNGKNFSTHPVGMTDPADNANPDSVAADHDEGYAGSIVIPAGFAEKLSKLNAGPSDSDIRHVDDFMYSAAPMIKRAPIDQTPRNGRMGIRIPVAASDTVYDPFVDGKTADMTTAVLLCNTCHKPHGAAPGGQGYAVMGTSKSAILGPDVLFTGTERDSAPGATIGYAGISDQEPDLLVTDNQTSRLCVSCHSYSPILSQNVSATVSGTAWDADFAIPGRGNPGAHPLITADAGIADGYGDADDNTHWTERSYRWFGNAVFYTDGVGEGNTTTYTWTHVPADSALNLTRLATNRGIAIPAFWPVGPGGGIHCMTCHDPHGGLANTPILRKRLDNIGFATTDAEADFTNSDNTGFRRVLLASDTRDEVSFCQNCHDPLAAAKVLDADNPDLSAVNDAPFANSHPVGVTAAANPDGVSWPIDGRPYVWVDLDGDAVEAGDFSEWTVECASCHAVGKSNGDKNKGWIHWNRARRRDITNHDHGASSLSADKFQPGNENNPNHNSELCVFCHTDWTNDIGGYTGPGLNRSVAESPGGFNFYGNRTTYTEADSWMPMGQKRTFADSIGSTVRRTGGTMLVGGANPAQFIVEYGVWAELADSRMGTHASGLIIEDGSVATAAAHITDPSDFSDNAYPTNIYGGTIESMRIQKWMKVTSWGDSTNLSGGPGTHNGSGQFSHWGENIPLNYREDVAGTYTFVVFDESFDTTVAATSTKPSGTQAGTTFTDWDGVPLFDPAGATEVPAAIICQSCHTPHNAATGLVEENLADNVATATITALMGRNAIKAFTKDSALLIASNQSSNMCIRCHWPKGTHPTSIYNTADDDVISGLSPASDTDNYIPSVPSAAEAQLGGTKYADDAYLGCNDTLAAAGGAEWANDTQYFYKSGFHAPRDYVTITNVAIRVFRKWEDEIVSQSWAGDTPLCVNRPKELLRKDGDSNDDIGAATSGITAVYSTLHEPTLDQHALYGHVTVDGIGAPLPPSSYAGKQPQWTTTDKYDGGVTGTYTEANASAVNIPTPDKTLTTGPWLLVCDSCHAPHASATGSGTFILEGGGNSAWGATAVTSPSELSSLGAVEPAEPDDRPTCLLCHKK